MPIGKRCFVLELRCNVFPPEPHSFPLSLSFLIFIPPPPFFFFEGGKSSNLLSFHSPSLVSSTNVKAAQTFWYARSAALQSSWSTPATVRLSQRPMKTLTFFWRWTLQNIKIQNPCQPGQTRRLVRASRIRIWLTTVRCQFLRRTRLIRKIFCIKETTKLRCLNSRAWRTWSWEIWMPCEVRMAFLRQLLYFTFHSADRTQKKASLSMYIGTQDAGQST